MEKPDRWSTLVFSDELVYSPVARAESGIVFPRAISVNLSDGTVRIQNGESELGPSYACMCGNKSATKGRCVFLSGSFADAFSLPSRVWPAVYEQWRRALKLFVAAHSCMGVNSPALEAAQKADLTHAAGRNFSLKRRYFNDGSSRNGCVVNSSCALFMIDGEGTGARVHYSKDEGQQGTKRFLCDACGVHKNVNLASKPPPSRDGIVLKRQQSA